MAPVAGSTVVVPLAGWPTTVTEPGLSWSVGVPGRSLASTLVVTGVPWLVVLKSGFATGAALTSEGLVTVTVSVSVGQPVLWPGAHTGTS